MARMVNRVTGPVSSDQLGGVLAHEHFVFGYPGFHGDESFNEFDREAFLEEMRGVAERLKKQGIRTVVDVTPNECGRDAALLKEISEATGLNIICSTGYYYEAESPTSYFASRRVFGFNPEAEAFSILERELNQGIGRTGIKAGVIKLASSKGVITEYEMMFFKAAARLAREDRNVRIITHTSEGTCIPEQVEFFLEQDVRPGQVQIGHFCGTTDVSIQAAALEKGFYGAFDRLGLQMPGVTHDKDRFICIAGLVAAGLGDKIVLSTDQVRHFWGRPYNFSPEIMKAYFIDFRWEYVVESVLPALKKHGLSDEQLHKFLYENPARFYGDTA